MTAASRITNVERILLVVPFVERVRREMERANIHRWSECELIRVTTDDGTVGYGETIQNYTWGRVPDTERVLGRSPFDCMWDDSLGAGLQMALFDAAGKLAGVPVHRCWVPKCATGAPSPSGTTTWDPRPTHARPRSPSNWASPRSRSRPDPGTTSTRPSGASATPRPTGSTSTAIGTISSSTSPPPCPSCANLRTDFPKISIWEGPIKADDVAGNRLLREKVRTPIAHHYGGVPGAVAIQQGYCDGFVVAGGVTNVMRSGISAATANMPFFIQMVGTGLTTTMALHLGAVLSHAQWPAINCHELYEHNLLSERIPVVGGFAQTPEAPGLGITLDENALDAYRVDKADFSLPRRLIRYSRANGLRVYFPDSCWSQQSFMWDYWRTANQPVYERGVHTEYLDDDGSPEFADIYRRAGQAPLLTRET